MTAKWSKVDLEEGMFVVGRHIFEAVDGDHVPVQLPLSTNTVSSNVRVVILRVDAAIGNDEVVREVHEPALAAVILKDQDSTRAPQVRMRSKLSAHFQSNAYENEVDGSVTGGVTSLARPEHISGQSIWGHEFSQIPQAPLSL